MTFDLVKARAICDHCCAPFSGVTDEHVSLAMSQFYDSLAEIERLRSREAGLEDRLVWQIKNFVKERDDEVQKQAARIKALEEALVEAKAAIKFCLDEGDEDEDYGPMHDLPEWRELPEKDKDAFRNWCRKQLQEEGKIGPDAKPRSWQITEERVGLLEYCLESLLDAPDIDESPGPCHSIEMLRAMLQEAAHPYPKCHTMLFLAGQEEARQQLQAEGKIGPDAKEAGQEAGQE